MKLSKKLLLENANFNEAKLLVGQTFESDLLRIHHYRDQLKVTDVVNAGKRGKKCREFSISGKSYDSTFNAFNDIMSTVYDKSTYDDVLAIAKTVADGDSNLNVYESELRGVDVIPTSLKPFEFTNDKVYIRSDIKSFTVRDILDRHNEETCISTDERTGVRGVKKFYDYLTKNPESVKDADFREIVDIFGKLGIGYHRYCAMD